MANITLTLNDQHDNKNPFAPILKIAKSIIFYFNRRAVRKNRDIIISNAVSLLNRGNDIILSCKTLHHWKTAERFLELVENQLEKELTYFENHEIPEVLDAKNELDLNFKLLNPSMDFVH